MNNIYVLKYDSENLGDDIQSIATMDMLQDMSIKHSYVYRDLINGYFFSPLQKNYIIFNGWFTNGYGMDTYYSVRDDMKENIQVTWPPKGNFKPILYSFHISEWGPKENRAVHPNFLEKSIDFYKSSINGSVGCRDEHTLKILQSLKIDSYFSGCVTLSFDKKKYTKLNATKNEILFVDVPHLLKEKLRDKSIAKWKGEAGYINLTHSISPLSIDLLDRFSLARRHLEAFCNAKLVFTTRLHVALPCLAFGTPVVFIVDDEEYYNSRYFDYLKYMNVIKYSEVEDVDLDKCLEIKYDGELSKQIRTNFEKIINNIIV